MLLKAQGGPLQTTVKRQSAQDVLPGGGATPSHSTKTGPTQIKTQGEREGGTSRGCCRKTASCPWTRRPRHKNASYHKR